MPFTPTTFDLVAPYTCQRPEIWGALVNAARWRLVRAIIGFDSRSTPGASGQVFIPYLNQLADEAFGGFGESVLSRAGSYGIGGSGASPGGDNGDFCMDATDNGGSVPTQITAAQTPWALAPRTYANTDYGALCLLDNNGTGLQQKPNPIVNFTGLDLSNLATDTIKAQVYGITAAGSQEITAWAMPSATNAFSYFGTKTATIAMTMGLASGTLAVLNQIVSLPYAAAKPIMQVELGVNTVGTATVLGARFRSTAAAPNGMSFQPIAAGGKAFADFTAAVPAWSFILQGIGPYDFAVLYSGINDAGTGISPSQLVTNMQAAIAALRLSLNSPNLPVLLLGDTAVSTADFASGSAFQASFDQYESARAYVAANDALVLHLNLRRATEEMGWTELTYANYTVDGVTHPNPESAQWIARYLFGKLMQVAQVAGTVSAYLVQPTGTGALASTINVKDSASAAPIVGATVRISGAQTATATTDASGNAAVSLNAGTISVGITAAGYSASNPTAHTVAASGSNGNWDGGGSPTLSLTLAAAVIAAATAPNQTTAYLTTRDGQGNASAAKTLTFALVDADAITDSHDQTAFTATSDSTGLLQVPLRQGTKYQARMSGGSWVAFTTGTAATYALPEVLGTYA